jgi:nucleoside-triphosphatase THEP1
LLATVAARGAGLIEEVKAHSGAELWEITGENRNQMPANVAAWFEGCEPLL